jgi:peptide/nickel transport system permease protein
MTRQLGPKLAVAYLALLVVLALGGSWLAPYDPFALSQSALSPPNAEHLMGTDNIGRDIFSGIIAGASTTLAVGLCTALIAGILGVLIGALAGYFGGGLDLGLMRVAEFFLMFPVFFVAIVIVALTGPGLSKVILVIGLTSWPGIARLVRVAILSLKKAEFVESAVALGCSSSRLVARHILPNGVAPAIVAASFVVGRSILTEAGLSFLGLGDPSLVSWGQMLNNAQQFLTRAWWLALFPGIAIALTVIAANALGDTLNDFMNPRLRTHARVALATPRTASSIQVPEALPAAPTAQLVEQHPVEKVRTSAR